MLMYSVSSDGGYCDVLYDYYILMGFVIFFFLVLLDLLFVMVVMDSFGVDVFEVLLIIVL